MLYYYLNDNIIINDYIVETPELYFTTSFDSYIYSDILNITLTDTQGYLKNVFSNNPYRFIFKIYKDNINIYYGTIVNYINVQNKITLQIKNKIDYSNSVTSYTTFNNLIMITEFILNNVNINYNKSSLYYAMIRFNGCKFLFNYGKENKLKDLFNEIINKTGIFIYNFRDVIYFDIIPDYFIGYSYELFDNQIISIEKENNIDNISNQYSTKYYNNNTNPISDIKKYEDSRLYYGIKNIKEIDGSIGLIYLNKYTAEYCSNIIINRTSYLNYRLTLYIKYENKYNFALGQFIKYKDYIYYISEYGYNKDLTQIKLVLLSENII